MDKQKEHQSADFALAAQEIMDAIRALHESGGIDDVFGRLPGEGERGDTAEAKIGQPLRYSMVIEWSDENQAFVVSLPEWGDLVHTHGATYEEALHQGKELIEGLVATRKERGEPLPAPRVFAAV
jgi:predicted RNase H-like HicB family nuclease